MSISEDVRNCALCPLSAKLDSSFKPQPGVGKINAKILFVYDMLTYDDYLTQNYLTSREGLLFDKMLAKCQLSRNEVYITPLVKCYAACRKDVTPSVVSTCGEWYDKQREALKPIVIIASGINSIAKTLGKSKNSIKMGEIVKTTVIHDTTLIIPFPALFSLFNAGNSTFNYHCDRLLEGKKWVSHKVMHMEEMEKN